MTTGKIVTAAIAVPAAIITGTLILVLAGVTSTTPRPTHTAGSGTLNEHAVPTWAVPLLHAAATTCPAITAPLLAAQIDTESDWNPTAYNTTSRAEGLAQFIPGTWAEFGTDGDHDGTADVRNPADAITSQARYMCHLIDLVTTTPGLTGDTVDLALAAYNAGPGNVRKHRGIPPFPETTHYIATIRRLAATTYTTHPPAATSTIERVIQAAAAHVDVTMYAWGGGTLTGPGPGMPPDLGITGFDCSALVRYAYHHGTNGTLTLPRTAQQQYNATRHHPITLADLQPGDLLFWGTPTHIHHVALYTGNNHMIEAPQSGHHITHTPIRTTGDYVGATRPLSSTAAAPSAQP